MKPRTALALAALALAGCGGHRPKPVSAEANGFPGYVVEADGHKVYIECRGTGRPTVVFVAGWGEEAANWGDLFNDSARLTRSCEYDRYGVGLTATYGIMAPKARDARDKVHELDQVLKNGGIPKPHVLVGHSWGGALARLYAGTHGDVKAVVFVDSAVPGSESAFHAAVPPRRAGEPQAITELRAPDPKPLESAENLDIGKSLAEAGKVTSLGDRPEIVITARGFFTGAVSFLFPVWMRLQNDLAGLSSDRVHLLAPRSSHFVQVDAPDLVLASIRADVNAVRDHRRLASCTAILGHLADGRCVG